MTGLCLHTFGSPRLELDGQALRPDTRKAVALLCVLALEGGSQRRDDLAGLLWSGDMSKKRASLRRTLSALNRVMPTPLEADRQRIALPATTLWVDALQFETQLAAAQAGQSGAEGALTRAVALYSDHFLRGFNLRGCPLFDNWKLERSERLYRHLTGALGSLLQLLDSRGAHEEAARRARRWLLLDPLKETAHRALMRSLAGAGQLSEALQHYDTLCLVLQRELGVDPSRETCALRAELLAKRAHPQPIVPLGLRAPLLGRDRELAHIGEHFDAGCRLVCVCSSPGVGKTSLAHAWLEREAARFPGGVCTLNADSLPEGATAERLSAWLAGTTRPGLKLALLDGCEARASEAPGWGELLEAWPELRLLVCSRQRLQLRGEQILELAGLDLEASRALFLREARKSRGQEPGEDELRGLAALIGALGGHPVCLRLAAIWSRLLDCQELLAEWQRAPDFLVSPQRDALERHQSARRLFADAWQSLPVEARPLLKELAALARFQPAGREDLGSLALLQDHCCLERLDEEHLRVVPWLASWVVRS